MVNDTYSTNEPASALWIEQAYNAAIYIGAIAYGAQLVVAYLAIYHVLYGKRRKFTWQYITYIILLVVVSTAYTAGNIHACQLLWIDERNYPGGPAAFLSAQDPPEDFFYSQNYTHLLIAGAAAIIITFLADVCLLWRCYVVYHNKWILVFPALILSSTTAMGVLSLIPISPHNSHHEITIQAYVAYRSLSVAFNILVTFMMVVRLLFIRKRIRVSLGPQYGQLYTGLATLMIKSALPHTVVSIVLIALYCSDNTAYLLFIPLLTMIEAVTPELIILRVASGYALSKETIGGDGKFSAHMHRRSSSALDLNVVPIVRVPAHTETTLLGISSAELDKTS
ncbi:hypothetical protein IW261DRAFT_287544 [Armillaria novae-zelandiae]|uniref:Uncharacterized protein n=1 Tax=Armillaria novae-zelandiae TaxID=153914 RepID=A0AA39U4K8_9AGAR|nr:hypothetical protein IW261DRAFT_287544 [Armillaria novae-zelandiae]